MSKLSISYDGVTEDSTGKRASIYVIAGSRYNKIRIGDMYQYSCSIGPCNIHINEQERYYKLFGNSILGEPRGDEIYDNGQ